MITLREIIQLDNLQHFHQIAGGTGYERSVVNVAIMDYEPISKKYDVFLTDEFVLTSLLFAKDNSDLANEAIQELIDRKVSAIAIKAVYDITLNEAVIDAANQANVCIFQYREIYMEDIIGEIKSLLKIDQDEMIYADMLERAVTIKVEEQRATVNKLVPSTYQRLRCIMIGYDGVLTTGIRQLRNNMQMDDCRIYIYQSTLLIILPIINSNHLSQCLKQIPFVVKGIGISDEVSYDYFIEALKQSEYAYQYAIDNHKQQIFFDQMDIHIFALAAYEQSVVQQYCKRHTQLIQQYDQDNNSNLYSTLRAYIAHHGDVKECAKDLFQHPNTVRYRIAKIKALLNKEDMEEKAFYEYLFLMIFLFK